MDEMAREYSYRARRCLREAELAYAEMGNPGTVRRSQEALELAVKALLRCFAVEYPREHDVSEALVEIESKLPRNLIEKLPTIRRWLGELAQKRGPALYRYEREAIAPSRAFTKEYATSVIGVVKPIVELCTGFVEETARSNSS